MDELQERIARIGLRRLAEHGFALAGGFALEAHGLAIRMSEDVDMFTDRWDKEEFGRAVRELAATYGEESLSVSVVRRSDTFARLQVSDPESAGTATVDLAADFRQGEPVTFPVGPVLAERDAVASKVAAVFSRAEARDYLDLTAILDSGRFTPDELLRMGREVDVGFTTSWFAEALAAIDRFPDEELARYGVDAEAIAHARETMLNWSHRLRR